MFAGLELLDGGGSRKFDRETERAEGEKSGNALK